MTVKDFFFTMWILNINYEISANYIKIIMTDEVHNKIISKTLIQ